MQGLVPLSLAELKMLLQGFPKLFQQTLSLILSQASRVRTGCRTRVGGGQGGAGIQQEMLPLFCGCRKLRSSNPGKSS